ncbi:MmcQ/YjbR family DNA-binding protein [Luteimonas sp. A611]
MDLNAVRALATSLPEVTEEPHFNYLSFRVRGKIFVTVPPDELHAHLFVTEEHREQTLAMHPEFAEKLLWGGKVVGLRVALADADPLVVAELVRQAWQSKAPRKVVAAWGGG